MCGIVGIVDLGGIDRRAVAPRLERALVRLRPRGPDGEGTWHGTFAALGHRRLAVIDLSPAAAQPMAAHGAVIVHNGEIYNFAELRHALEAEGHRFATRSDTEVLLAAWRAWGEAMLPKLVGMFAFAIWEPAARRLILARDRFGKKPLLYRHRGSEIAFASDLAALEAMAGEKGAIDPAALRMLFTLRYLPEPMSIVADVGKLPAGHVACFEEGRLALRRWYQPADTRPAPFADEQEAAAELARRFDQAVAARLVADVPVGVFLSAGIDSALIAASAARATGRLRTFTVGFENVAPYYEERPGARAVAAHVGAEHTEIAVASGGVRESLDAVFDALDEPFADSSAVPAFILARETRAHVTVALSGDGADEVFGGYRKYQGEIWAGVYQTLPRPLRTRMIAPAVLALPESKAHPVLELARRLRRFVSQADKDAVGRQAGWARLLGEEELDSLFVQPVPGPSLEALIAELRGAAETEDPLNAMLAADLALGLVSDMLVKVDRTSMAHGLEVRCPYLDHRVVEVAQAMPGRFKLARGEGKRILRRAFAERLPAEVFERPKKGFELPIAQWLTHDLADLTRRAIDPVRLRRQGLFRPDLPRRWFAQLATGRRDTAERLWTLVAFQAWSERHGRALAAV